MAHLDGLPDLLLLAHAEQRRLAVGGVVRERDAGDVGEPGHAQPAARGGGLRQTADT